MDNIPSVVLSLEELHTVFDELLLHYTTHVKDNLNSFITDTLSTASENMLSVLEHYMLSAKDLHSITTEVLQNDINIVQINYNLNSLITDALHWFTNSDEALTTGKDKLFILEDLQYCISDVLLKYYTQLNENFNTLIVSVSQTLHILTASTQNLYKIYIAAENSQNTKFNEVSNASTKYQN